MSRARAVKLAGSANCARAVAGVGLLGLTACAAEESEERITVYAAASLQEVYEEIGELYTEETGTEVEFSFAGSADLLAQLEQGAPADALVTADTLTMSRAQEAGLVSEAPQIFAANTVVLATPAGNPADITGVEDLEREDVVSVLCAEQVPCGALSTELTAAAGVEPSPASEENSVTDVLGKIRSGEADAGLVYATDAQAAGDEVETIEIDDAEDHLNHYPGAVLDAADTPEAATEFLAFLAMPEAEEVLAEAGFRTADGETHGED